MMTENEFRHYKRAEDAEQRLRDLRFRLRLAVALLECIPLIIMLLWLFSR